MKPTTPTAGFTLIEMLVSLSLFTIVITITLGAFLILISGNQGFVARQSVMDTLAFSLDSMTREIRTGSYYVCVSVNNASMPIVSPHTLIPSMTPPPVPFGNPAPARRHDAIGERVRNCSGGSESGGSNALHGLSFIEGGDSITGPTAQRILYYYSAAPLPTGKTIFRRVGNNPAERIIPENIVVENAEFFVTGAVRLPGSDTDQPVVTLVIQAREASAAISETITLQTTITQRSLDL